MTSELFPAFNLSDSRPEIEKLIHIAKIADARSYGAINRLADYARRDFFGNNGSTETAQLVYDSIRGFKNKNIAKKFEKDFNAFCGAFCQISDGKSGFKLGYLREADLVEFKNGIIFRKEHFQKLFIAAKVRTEILIRGKFKFMELTLITPPQTDNAAIAKRRYNVIMTALKDLRDSYQDWQDCELSTEIIRLLDGASKALPSLKIGWLETAIAELDKAALEKEKDAADADAEARELQKPLIDAAKAAYKAHKNVKKTAANQ